MKIVRIGVFAAILAAAVVNPAAAACNATINGLPMPPQMCALAAEVYGSVRPGHYWMDERGNWGYVGNPYPQGNLRLDSQRPRASGTPWTYRGAGGAMGSDGQCTYYNDPSTGASVMTGNC